MPDIPFEPFEAFPKIHRFSRPVIVTEKIDGTNAQIWIDPTGTRVHAGSRNRWITPDNDNFGFARWVQDNHDELLKLGPGSHYGEWWGAGIQRRYGLNEKRFSLFNVRRWKEERPACCHVVPVLWEGSFEALDVALEMKKLRDMGSAAAPGFSNPEGVVVFHVPSQVLFKKTFDKDDSGKGE